MQYKRWNNITSHRPLRSDGHLMGLATRQPCESLWEHCESHPPTTCKLTCVPWSFKQKPTQGIKQTDGDTLFSSSASKSVGQGSMFIYEQVLREGHSFWKIRRRQVTHRGLTQFLLRLPYLQQADSTNEHETHYSWAPTFPVGKNYLSRLAHHFDIQSRSKGSKCEK